MRWQVLNMWWLVHKISIITREKFNLTLFGQYLTTEWNPWNGNYNFSCDNAHNGIIWIHFVHEYVRIHLLIFNFESFLKKFQFYAMFENNIETKIITRSWTRIALQNIPNFILHFPINSTFLVIKLQDELIGYII